MCQSRSHCVLFILIFVQIKWINSNTRSRTTSEQNWINSSTKFLTSTETVWGTNIQEKVTEGVFLESNMTETLNSETDIALISEDVYNKFKSIHAESWIPLSVIGIVVNALNIAVFSDKQLRNPTSIYLAAISFLQIVQLCLGMVSKIHQLIYGTVGQRSTKFYYFAAIYMNNYLGPSLTRIVYYLVFLVSFERMVAIRFPLRKKWFTFVKSPGKCITLVFVLTIVFHVYSPLKYDVVETFDANETITGYTLQRTHYDLATLTNFSLAAKIIFVYIPLLGILVCNIVLTVTLRRQEAIRQHLQEIFVGRERQTNVAILVSTFVFFVFNLPPTTNAFVGDLLPDYNFFSANRHTLLFFQGVGSLCTLISSSTDFVTYIIISHKFREIFTRKFVPFMAKKRHNVYATHYGLNNPHSVSVQSSSLTISSS